MSKIKVLRGGKLIDGTGRPPLNDMVIVIEDSKIIEVGRNDEIEIPKEAQIIDVDGNTIIPGMIDAHVHLCYGKHGEPEYLKPYRSIIEAKNLLNAGFTAVRCCGSIGTPYLKSAIELGIIAGPRIMAARIGLSSSIYHISIGKSVDGVEDCRRAVREEISQGADFIKIFASASSVGKNPKLPVLTLNEIKAITEEAHRVGVKVGAHAIGGEGLTNAILGGVDTIEHGRFLDDDLCRQMVKMNIIYIPTFMTYHLTLVDPYRPLFSYLEVKNTEDGYDAHVASVKNAHKAGVKIVTGTDLGPTLPFGMDAGELEWLNKLGLTPMEAIVSATKYASEAIGLENQIGTIEKGKLADLVIVYGDPLVNIEILKESENLTVMKNGEIIKTHKKLFT